ncbi:hypothetical protein CEUSTIGMA_g13683.t1 [Chlamydomonas eustigma]|uniref:Uncharacterized protein n=1 Tax=Chlamydomonas eustigma TaxID=1157962 RepID=A0A250XT49_9CHLO|nr:hypothetical protein CEUSTIGMA_g13683.t1 [Chlamydomonas eustigma]|eukprot:GAX86271.1 hypothetical protein CEUSTIGMA_g13683.t1 [Chlamydomonas eustigma]
MLRHEKKVIYYIIASTRLSKRRVGLLSLEDRRQHNEVKAAQVAESRRRRRTPNEASLERRLRIFQTLLQLNITTEQRNHQDGEVDNGRASMTCNEPSFATAAELVEKQLQQLVEHVHLVGGDSASAPSGAQNVQAGSHLRHRIMPKQRTQLMGLLTVYNHMLAAKTMLSLHALSVRRR